MWVTVDVVRKKVRCKDIMEPEKGCRENMMAYVLGFEEGASAGPQVGVLMQTQTTRVGTSRSATPRSTAA